MPSERGQEEVGSSTQSKRGGSWLRALPAANPAGNEVEFGVLLPTVQVHPQAGLYPKPCLSCANQYHCKVNSSV